MSKNNRNRGSKIVSSLEGTRQPVTGQTVFCYLEEARRTIAELEPLVAGGPAGMENSWWGAEGTLRNTRARVQKIESMLSSSGRGEILRG